MCGAGKRSFSLEERLDTQGVLFGSQQWTLIAAESRQLTRNNTTP